MGGTRHKQKQVDKQLCLESQVSAGQKKSGPKSKMSKVSLLGQDMEMEKQSQGSSRTKRGRIPKNKSLGQIQLNNIEELKQGSDMSDKRSQVSKVTNKSKQSAGKKSTNEVELGFPRVNSKASITTSRTRRMQRIVPTSVTMDSTQQEQKQVQFQEP